MNYSKSVSQVKFNQNKVQFDDFSVKLDLTIMKESFGEWLKRRRKERGLNQPELARLAHTTKATISLLESDKISQPRLDNIDNIAKSLGIPFEEMRQVFAEKFVITNQNAALPEPLKISDFNGYDKSDIEKIKSYMEFLKSQKKQEQ